MKHILLFPLFCFLIFISCIDSNQHSQTQKLHEQKKTEISVDILPGERVVLNRQEMHVSAFYTHIREMAKKYDQIDVSVSVADNAIIGDVMHIQKTLNQYGGNTIHYITGTEDNADLLLEILSGDRFKFNGETIGRIELEKSFEKLENRAEMVLKLIVHPGAEYGSVYDITKMLYQHGITNVIY